MRAFVFFWLFLGAMVSTAFCAEYNPEKTLDLVMFIDQDIQVLDQRAKLQNTTWQKLLGDKIEELVKEGANPNVKTRARGTTPLHFAAQFNRSNLIELLVKRGATVDSKDNSLTTPFTEAARFGSLDALSTLHKLKANIESMNNLGHRPLMVAASNSKIAAIELLASFNADIEARCHRYETALGYGATYGNKEAVIALLRLGAHARPALLRKANGTTRMLLAAFFNDDDKHDQGPTWFHAALRKDNQITRSALRSVLELADENYLNNYINEADSVGLVPIDIAVVKKDEEFIDLLCARGVDLSQSKIAKFILKDRCLID